MCWARRCAFSSCGASACGRRRRGEDNHIGHNGCRRGPRGGRGEGGGDGHASRARRQATGRWMRGERAARAGSVRRAERAWPGAWGPWLEAAWRDPARAPGAHTIERLVQIRQQVGLGAGASRGGRIVLAQRNCCLRPAQMPFAPMASSLSPVSPRPPSPAPAASALPASPQRCSAVPPTTARAPPSRPSPSPCPSPPPSRPRLQRVQMRRASHAARRSPAP